MFLPLKILVRNIFFPESSVTNALPAEHLGKTTALELKQCVQSLAHGHAYHFRNYNDINIKKRWWVNKNERATPMRTLLATHCISPKSEKATPHAN